MRAFRITDVKLTMNHLLAKETFDQLLLSEAELFSGVTMTLDGHLRDDFYTEEEYESYRQQGEFLPYSELRKILYEAVKGKHTPSSLRLVFVLPKPLMEQILKDADAVSEGVSGLYLNLRYNAEGLTAVTGISMKSFSMDKSAEQAWDAYAPVYLEQLGIPVELA